MSQKSAENAVAENCSPGTVVPMNIDEKAQNDSTFPITSPADDNLEKLFQTLEDEAEKRASMRNTSSQNIAYMGRTSSVSGSPTRRTFHRNSNASHSDPAATTIGRRRGGSVSVSIFGQSTSSSADLSNPNTSTLMQAAGRSTYYHSLTDHYAIDNLTTSPEFDPSYNEEDVEEQLEVTITGPPRAKRSMSFLSPLTSRRNSLLAQPSSPSVRNSVDLTSVTVVSVQETSIVEQVEDEPGPNLPAVTAYASSERPPRRDESPRPSVKDRLATSARSFTQLFNFRKMR